MTQREKELNVLFNKNHIVRNWKWEVKLIQHYYIGPIDYNPKIPLPGFAVPGTLISNLNAGIGKGIPSLSYAVNTEKYWYEYYRRCGIKSYYVKKIDGIVDGWLIWYQDTELPDDNMYEFITTYELFYLLNECYPQDYKGYGEINETYPKGEKKDEYDCLKKCNFKPWDAWSERRLLSHLRYRSNDIDCYKMDENGNPIEVYESKRSQRELESALVKCKGHYDFRKIFHREIEGLELKFVTDDKVFLK